MINKIKTLKDLKKSGYVSLNIKEEMIKNLTSNLSKGISTFEGIHGYEDSVIPDLERAILSGHNINLLGLRGQAKTRLARQLTNLLDEWIPIVSGSEINDDPLNPISHFAKKTIQKKKVEIRTSFFFKLFSKNMLVRYQGKNNKGVLERPGTKWKVLRAISSTLKCQFTGKC